MTQFKDKSSKKANFSAGLFTYPVLMASDILLYDCDYVPVGQDQKQHVELARNIAERVNKKFNKDVFKMPEPLIMKGAAKIFDLADPTKKMSKSAENLKGVILVNDDEKTIRKKIASATTDSMSRIKFAPEEQPGISNLMTIMSCLTGKSYEEIEEEFKDKDYGFFKTKVADSIVDTLMPIQERYNELLNSDELDKILDEGREKTLKIAKDKYELLRKTAGLGR